MDYTDVYVKFVKQMIIMNSSNLNRYVKIKDNSSWFLVLEPGQKEPAGLSKMLHEKLVQAEVDNLLKPGYEGGWFPERVIFASTNFINYEEQASRHGTLLIRPIGSYMLMSGAEVIEEKYAESFPIDNVNV